MGAGFAVLAAARSAAAGADAAALARAAREMAAGDAGALRRRHPRAPAAGGAGSASRPSILGSAIGVEPVLRVLDGQVVPLEKVRTDGPALHGLVQRAVETGEKRPGTKSPCTISPRPSGPSAWRRSLRERLPGVRELRVERAWRGHRCARRGPGAVERAWWPPFWREPDEDDVLGARRRT